MLTWWQVYLLTRIDNISILLMLPTIFSGVAALILTIMMCVAHVDEWTHENSYNKIKFWLKRSIIVFIMGLTLCSAMPSTKEVAAIYFLPKIVNNEHVQNLPGEAVKLLDTQFKKWISEFTEKEKK